MVLLHSFWAYLVLISVLVAFVKAWVSRKEVFQKRDKIIALIAMTMVHLQLIFGLVVYVLGNRYEINAQTMGNQVQRLLSIEHPSVMVLAIVLITIGYSKSKRQQDSAKKFKTIRLFYGLGLVLMLTRIPWAQWFS